MWLDQLVALIAETVDAWSFELGKRSFGDWALFFAPLLLLEVPQYYLPLVGLVVARWLGLGREDRLRQERFVATRPSVTVLIVGRNEGATIDAAIQSLLEQDYPDLEILVVDDSSDDDMSVVVGRYARRGRVRLVRNESATGRNGKPGAANLGLRLANGEVVICIDADTTFDLHMIQHMLAPLADPKVGVVAGNVLVRNTERNFLTRLQTLEYFVSIDLHKRWTHLFGRTLQASGAIGAFRRSALLDIGGWDQQLAEDGDVSLRMVKAGWKIAFAPRAVALTNVPTTWRALSRQRTRWDRGGLRAYFVKHGRLLLPGAAGGSFAFGMWTELFMSVVMSLVYPFYLVWLLASGLFVFSFVMATCALLYLSLSVLPVLALVVVSRRAQRPWRLIWPALLMPLYKEGLRWVRIKALVMELLRIRYEDPFLPDQVWLQAPRY